MRVVDVVRLELFNKEAKRHAEDDVVFPFALQTSAMEVDRSQILWQFVNRYPTDELEIRWVN